LPFDDTSWRDGEPPERAEFLADLARQHSRAIFLALATLYEDKAGELYPRVIANMHHAPDVKIITGRRSKPLRRNAGSGGR
jgi:hypothetical protein